MMRVTSSMMTNNMILNVNRSMRNLMTAEMQFSSTRRIQAASDNPLIAARHMKFTSNLAQNEDFQNNVDNALAWMDVTESALDGVLQVLLNEVRDTLNHAHNDPLALEGRKTLATSLRHFRDQIGHQMNTPFAGRYVFSGLRTNLPPVFTQHQPDLVFRITQNFELRDVERTRALQIFQPEADGQVGLPYYPEVHILKLPYNNIRPRLDDSVSPPVPFDPPQVYLSVTASDGDPDAPTPVPHTQFNVIVRSNTERNAYIVPPRTNPTDPPNVVLIQETGELVFDVNDTIGESGASLFPLEITYDRHGFQQGELNPAVYFNATLLSAPTGHPQFPAHWIQNSNPVFPLHCTNRRFDMYNQDMIYEFSTHTTIPVNVLAKDVLTPNLFADLNRLITFIEGIVPTDPARLRAQFENLFPDLDEEALQKMMYDHIADENQRINLAMNNRINNMLFLIDRHAAQVRTQVTDIGSRGRRLEMFQNRLEQDEGSLTQLWTSNIGADMARATTMLATAEAQYMAAISVGTRIINTTLLNFLQV